MASQDPCTNVKAPAALSIFTASASGFLSLITISGNLLIILAVYKDPYGKLRTPFMFFLVNLALSDLVVGCLAMPTSVATHTMEVLGTKKKEHVQLILMVYFISATASLLNFGALSVDRYFAIVHPLTYRRSIKFSRCIVAAAAIWCVSLSLPMLYFITGYMTYLMIFAHTGIIASSVILIFSYFKIFKALRQQTNKFAPNNASTRGSSVRNAEKKVTEVFITALCAFSGLFIPVVIMIYILKFCTSCDCTLRHVLRDLQFLFAISSSALNPFVCTLKLTPFRQALVKIFGVKGNGISSRKHDKYAVENNEKSLPTTSTEN